MDFDGNEAAFEEILNNANFTPHFEDLELDSLLYENVESPESSSSSGFYDQNPGYRSRDSGSLGDSSTDSSPPLSCTNYTENDQEMWEFGFQNPSPFQSSNQQYDNAYQEEYIETPQKNGFVEQQYIEHEEIVEEEPMPRVHVPRKQIFTFVQKNSQVQPVKRVTSAPIQKFYRIREAPQTQRAQTYRVVQRTNPHTVIRKPQLQQHRAVHYREEPKPVFYTEGDRGTRISSGPLICQVLPQEGQRYVPIAPIGRIKQEMQTHTPEQNRKIRNRMYAQASRIRKKEADEIMRNNLEDLTIENEKLKNENAVLRQRLSYYESEDPPIRSPQPIQFNRSQKNKKMFAAGTALMMFGLFAVISPFNLLNNDGRVGVTNNIMAITNETSALIHRGRVIPAEGSTAVIRKSQENMHRYNGSNYNDCEMYKLNATETRRVNNDIERWVQVHSFEYVPVKFAGGLVNKEAMRKFNDAQRPPKMANFGPNKESVQKKADQAAIRSRERTWRQLDLLKAGSDSAPADNEKLQRKRQSIAKIASMIRQKGDTLYIMTLQDYVLLPSLHKGSNSRPKLSLLLPSVPMNGTLLDQYSLLRVDCEVTGTGQLTLSNKQLSYLMP